MSDLVERIIAARDALRPLRSQGEEYIRNPAVQATEVMADAANALSAPAGRLAVLRTELLRLSEADLRTAEELLQDPDGEDCERFSSRYGRTLLNIARAAIASVAESSQ